MEQFVKVNLPPGIYKPGAVAYSAGLYGRNLYGVGAITSSQVDADTWAFDNFGEFLVACLTGDGKVYSWDKNVANDLAQVAGSPAGVRAVVVTPERFLFA